MPGFLFLLASSPMSVVATQAQTPLASLDGPAILVLIFVAIFVIAAVIIWQTRFSQDTPGIHLHEHHHDETHTSHAAAPDAEPVVELPAAVVEVATMPATTELITDDLAIIEGIGPKIAAAFNARGITTFSQLAIMEVNSLEAILDDLNLPMADPATWPEQARLAAAGDWEALQALQLSLKAGRRAAE